MTTNPERSATAHHLFAEHRAGELLWRGGGRGVAARQVTVHQREHRHRVKEMQSEHPAGVLRRGPQFHHRDARGVGGQHGIGIGEDVVELGEDDGLDLLVSDDRFDDELTVCQIRQRRGEGQTRQRAVTLPLGDLARADAALRRRDDPARPAADRASVVL